MKSEGRSRNCFLTFIFFFCLCITTFFYSNSFEANWNEIAEVRESYYPLAGHFDPRPFNDSFNTRVVPDRGVALPVMLRLQQKINSDSIAWLRLLPSLFFLISIYLCYRLFRVKLGDQWGLVTALFLSTNANIFYYCNLISPYSLNLLTTLLLYFSYLYLVSKKSNLRLHAIISISAIITFYTSVIPVSLIFLLSKFKYCVISLKKTTAYYWLLGVVLYKGFIVIYFRLVDRGIPTLSFPSRTLEENILQFIELFGSDLASFSNHSVFVSVFRIFILLLFIIVIIQSMLSRREDKLLKLFNFYLLTSIFSFTLLKLTGAEEIEPRYYLGILPLFYYALVLFILKIKTKIARVLLVILVVGSNLYQTINVIRYRVLNKAPIVSISKYLLPIMSSRDLACFSLDIYGEDLAYLKVISEALISEEEKSYVNVRQCEELLRTGEWLNKENIYFITDKKIEYIEGVCEHFSKPCKDKPFYGELGRRKIILVHQTSGRLLDSQTYIYNFAPN